MSDQLRIGTEVEVSGAAEVAIKLNLESETAVGLVISEDTAQANASLVVEGNDGTDRFSVYATDANGAVVTINQDSNDGSNVYAISITSDNAGAGKGCGIDFSTFAVDEPVFKFLTDASGSAKDPQTVSQDDWVCVENSAGTLLFIPAYAAS
jgi:hypothetical protein